MDEQKNMNTNIALRRIRHHLRTNLKYARKPKRYRQVLSAAAETGARSIVEVGVYKGVRGVEIIEASSLLTAPEEIEYFGFDLFEGMNPEIMTDEYSKWPDAMAKVAARLERTGATVELVAGFTQDTLPEFVATRSGRGVDFVFIDGGHAVETIRSDWSHLSKLMHSGTAVLFDDFYVDCPHLTDRFGCNQVMEELDTQVFEWRVLEDVDRFVIDGQPHNVAMTKVTRAPDAAGS